MTNQEIQKIAEETYCAMQELHTPNGVDDEDHETIHDFTLMRIEAILSALKQVRDAQDEKLRIARDLLMHVDNRAQQDFNGVNWYDAREEFIEKMGVK